MEIFGIPVILIVGFIFWILDSYAKDQQKRQQKAAAVIEEITTRWDAIAIGMSVADVLEELGKPIRVVKTGGQEAWGYGPDSSDGEIMFIEGRVVGYQKPSFTVNVHTKQSAEADTADVPHGHSRETDKNKG